MPPVYQIGRVGRVYAKRESTYGTAATLAAGDAIRSLMTSLNENTRNRVNSPERHTHPSQVYRFTRKQTADGRLRGIFYPSGTLNTVPDHDPLLENAFGAFTNVTLSTTVSATPAPTSTVFTVASAAGLVIGDAILINVTTGSPATGRVVRVITAIAGAALTVDPALPQAPASTDTVKGCLTYKLATALPQALTLAKYLTSVSYQLEGWVTDEIEFTFDANEEVMYEVSGPAKNRTRPAQTDPTTATTAGTTPPSGLTATLRADAAAEEFLKVVVRINNNMALDDHPAGITSAQNYYRRNKREVTFEVTVLSSDDLTLLTNAEATTDHVLLAQTGQTEGSIIGIYAPVVEFDVPEDPDDEETMEHVFRGTCKGTTTGNDELRLIVA